MRWLRGLSTVLIAAGVLLLADVGVTLAWQEPFSAIYAELRQAALEDELDRLDGLTAAEARALARLAEDREKLAFLARSLRRRTDEGDAIGRIRIPGIGVSRVIVEGTDAGELREGPGHYPRTSLPGMRGTVGVAGHRTTYGAPFNEVDKLEKGDRITVEMPYGRFTYRVEGARIVPPTAVEVVRRVSYDRLVLSACHPKYSAAERIVVFARQVESELTVDGRSSGRRSS
ncbi:MAG: class E sortase [Thermoleophilaceae bacterium]